MDKRISDEVSRDHRVLFSMRMHCYSHWESTWWRGNQFNSPPLNWFNRFDQSAQSNKSSEITAKITIKANSEDRLSLINISILIHWINQSINLWINKFFKEITKFDNTLSRFVCRNELQSTVMTVNEQTYWSPIENVARQLQ